MRAAIAVAVLVYWGCTGQPIVKPPADKPIFDFSGVNQAWGFHCRGSYITGSGQVRSYVCDKPDDSVPEFKNRRDWARAIQYRFFMNDSLVGNRDPLEVLEMYQLLFQAESEPLTKPKNLGADMGGWSIRGILYDTLSQLPRDVLLSQSGDWECHRDGPASARLLKWLAPEIAPDSQ